MAHVVVPIGPLTSLLSAFVRNKRSIELFLMPWTTSAHSGCLKRWIQPFLCQGTLLGNIASDPTRESKAFVRISAPLTLTTSRECLLNYMSVVAWVEELLYRKCARPFLPDRLRHNIKMEGRKRSGYETTAHNEKYPILYATVFRLSQWYLLAKLLQSVPLCQWGELQSGWNMPMSQRVDRT